MRFSIHKVTAREIIDSRGHPTVEATVLLDNGMWASAMSPSGASVGEHEALELRDEDRLRLGGKGVLKAVSMVNTEIDLLLHGRDACAQLSLDRALCELDGTSGKTRLGANATLAVSLAAAHAAAKAMQVPLYRHIGGSFSHMLPLPLFNVINGGAHADNPLDFQEFMVVPTGAESFADAMRTGMEVFYALKEHLRGCGHATNVGDEGGFAPQLVTAEQALDLIVSAVDKTRYRLGEDIHLAIDAASSELFDGQHYDLQGAGRKLSSAEMVDYLAELARAYPICSIEDGMAENDWAGWQNLTQCLGSHVQLVGDDLFATNKVRLKRGIGDAAGNAILVKPNQIGTLSETLEAMDIAHRGQFACVVSHRSGETEDTTIADLAVATNAGQIKTGSLSRSDRVAKYNRLLAIERELGDAAVFAGRRYLPRVGYSS